MLGQLANQFGRATGMRGALRDAIGTFDEETKGWKARKPDPAEYGRTMEPHQRGAILVAAIFDAFIKIYENRVADLLRLYTGGSGILPAGAVHPDLVDRLAQEATKAAGHVLTMCVRGLDYCPPVDLTFGEYLRAVITADHDVVRDDDRNYRVAFVEAFRRRGIYPRDVRTLSVENLLWREPGNDDRKHSAELLKLLQRLRDRALNQIHTRDRRDLFRRARGIRGVLHDALKKHFETDSHGKEDAAFLGLEQPGSFEVHSVNFASRVGPDGDLLLQAILQITQGKDVPVGDEEDGESMHFEGGCTLIVDLEEPSISYCVRKPMGSDARCLRQQRFVEDFGRSLHATYFGRGLEDRQEPFALLHRGGF
jgi:hypothetical protein